METWRRGEDWTRCYTPPFSFLLEPSYSFIRLFSIQHQAVGSGSSALGVLQHPQPRPIIAAYRIASGSTASRHLWTPIFASDKTTGYNNAVSPRDRLKVLHAAYAAQFFGQ